MSSSVFLVLFICFQFSCSGINLVVADEALMPQECYNADNPELCMQCLESYPSAKLATRAELPSMLVACLSKHATHLKANMYRLAKESKGIPKKVYNFCLEWFVYAEGELSKASMKLEQVDFDGVDNHVGNALAGKGACIVELDNVHLPDEVMYEMSVYQDLCEATMRVLDRLLSSGLSVYPTDA